MRMKRIFTFLLLTLFVAYSFAATVASGTCGAEGDGSNLTWELGDDGTLTIRGTGYMKDFVSRQDPSPWEYNNNILNVVVEQGILNIGDDAFLCCEKIITVDLPTGMESIGEAAFNYCFDLEGIIIPEGVTEVGVAAFLDCISLERIELPSTLKLISNYAFFLNQGSKCNTIICRAIDPPTCLSDKWSPFDGIGYDIGIENVTVYVPEESIDLYRNAAGWDYFTNFLPLEDMSAAINDNNDNEATIKVYARDGRIYCDCESGFAVYNLAGREVSEQDGNLHGMYVVVAGDEVVKVLIE